MTLPDPDRLTGRQVLLAALTEEPACADTAADLLTESRLGGALALAGVVVLAAVVAWLQTEADIRFPKPVCGTRPAGWRCTLPSVRSRAISRNWVFMPGTSGPARRRRRFECCSAVG
ncbi:hypothetical protein [Kitasatospora sp. CB02891]|uniref:hypothetical protein n=1 Tax=Kitasatospora sp. CB02891 TaxID=2020329 RepID=UPI000C2749BF|nr:hypothetical protein [Kitasatospora sp. CB02891]PJN25395.1 hypothetical protein CG736_13310 [Kitasatospora sp. CB02891]